MTLRFALMLGLSACGGTAATSAAPATTAAAPAATAPAAPAATAPAASATTAAAAAVPAAAGAPSSSFDGLRCDSDVGAALRGRTMPRGPVAATEAKYTALALKNLGAFGDEPDGDPWTAVSWSICGKEHMLLQKGNVVRDVLVSTEGAPPSVFVSCEADGAKVAGTAVTFTEANGWPKPVKEAWRIDDTALRFQKVAGSKIVCEP